ncbi:hypothetical protein COU19_02960 [Candidatus Kaiserbacteria bacterium CG10_big_fil_rev_8_21_14_0_10_56_12]|uniref:Aminoglycoside phosphotransferase domain-containing protein n=1 Tax=Candidatus Kaiserbacteria bacterium CG10_big_fil_rev_8_21_14_0_10_56_12 TaxID=1974611 RepID=A0A2H0U9A3_9BACT|nr:MAG: hypothetical protein COU19_02960 [Candidatus Kaiserbacteria bacterium CG10_big_fil_rev_8_21_14_0_10_56_12]
MMHAPTLTKKRLETVLAQHYRLGRLRSYARLKKGLGNALYHVSTEKGDYTLKIAIRNNPVRVRYEIDLLNTLSRLPTPTPLKTRQGGYLFDYHGYQSFMYPFLPGEHRKRMTPTMLKDVGIFLGKLHFQTEGYTSKINRFRFYDITSKNRGVIMRDSRRVKHPRLREAVEYM